MTAYVFLGPTLPIAEARRHLDAVYLPPVAQGDIHRVMLERPSLIGIVDGYFEQVPSVWHKEILWALDQGIPVLGASSMGALRAAELDAFGMRGVGRVYEAFRDGDLEDDDEVAVVHAPADEGYRALSEAMVNIRRTVGDAAEAAVIGPATRELVIEAAKSLYYPDRSYPAALGLAAEAGADPDELAALRRYVTEHAVDQKREDALALLHAMHDQLEDGETTVDTRFTFEYSEFWYEAHRTAGQLAARHSGDDGSTDGSEVPATGRGGLLDELLDELRLDPDSYLRVWNAAYARLSAVEQARSAGMRVSSELLQEIADTFRRERGLLEPEDARAWLRDNDLTEGQIAGLLRDEAQRRHVRGAREHAVTARLADELRFEGSYPALVQRTRDKARRLSELGWDEVSLGDLGVSWDEVLDHHFRRRLGREVPQDLAGFAQAHGYLDESHLRRALLREYAYEVASGPREAAEA